jgi:hypothetical protein
VRTDQLPPLAILAGGVRGGRRRGHRHFERAQRRIPIQYAPGRRLTQLPAKTTPLRLNTSESSADLRVVALLAQPIQIPVERQRESRTS